MGIDLSVLEQAGLVQTKRKGKFRVIAFNRMPLESLLKRWFEPEGR